MAYTTHGYHISGTVKDDPPPDSVARCGGPGLCGQCGTEAIEAIFHSANSTNNSTKKEAPMNQFEKISEALETAADELEKIPRRLQGRAIFFTVNSEILRAEADYYYKLAEAVKEADDASVPPS